MIQRRFFGRFDSLVDAEAAVVAARLEHFGVPA